PDGNFWFTEPFVDRIGRMTISGAFTEFAVTAGSQPYSITVGPDLNLWFTERNGNRIGKMDPSGTLIAEYPIPTANSYPYSIAAGPGGLWFTEPNSNKIGRI